MAQRHPEAGELVVAAVAEAGLAAAAAAAVPDHTSSGDGIPYGERFAACLGGVFALDFLAAAAGHAHPN